MKQKCLDTERLLSNNLKIEQRCHDVDQTEPLIDSNCNDTHVIDLPDKNFSIDQFLEESSIASEPSEHRQVKTRSKRDKSPEPKKLKSRVSKSKNKKPETHDYRCFICEKVFDLISAKDLHVKQDHADIKICKICNKRKQTAIALETHLRYHFFGYRFLCSSCGKSFRFRNLLENHLKVEHYNFVKFSCDMCHYSTKFKINLERHAKVSLIKQQALIYNAPNFSLFT